MSSATSVPRWSITENASDVMNGSSQPRSSGTTIRCPEDETGRNSVSPCTTPMTSAWIRTSMGEPSAHSPFGAPTLADEQRGEDEGDRGQQLDEDVERRPCGVLEGIAHRVADDGRRVGERLLAEDVAVLVLEVTSLDVLLGVVPRAAA